MVICCSLVMSLTFTAKVAILLSNSPISGSVFQLCFKKSNFSEVKLREPETLPHPPSFYRVGKTFYHKRHIFKFEWPSYKMSINSMEKNRNMIRCHLRKDYLMDLLKMILLIYRKQKYCQFETRLEPSRG